MVLRRLAEAADIRGGLTVLVELLRYPALLAMYAAGIAMVDRANYSGLNAVLACEARTGNERRPLVAVLSLHEVAGRIDDGLRQETRKHTPVSNELYAVLRAVFRDLIPTDEGYQDVFDYFEYLQTLAQVDYRINSKRDFALSGGCFEWRGSFSSPEWPPNIVNRGLERDGSGWAPLQAGMFGGDIARLKQAKRDVDKMAHRRNFRA